MYHDAARLSALALLAVAMAACSNPYYPNPITPSPSDSSGISFSNVIQPIFTANCALSGCHAGTNPQDGMSLEAGKAYANIVNQPNIEYGDYLIVEPYYADSSYLYFKITGNPIAGPRMPYGKSPLPDSLIQVIKDWINQGAKDN